MVGHPYNCGVRRGEEREGGGKQLPVRERGIHRNNTQLVLY